MDKLLIMALIYAGVIAAVAVLVRHANHHWSSFRIAATCALPLPMLGLLYAIGTFLYLQTGAVTKVGDSIPFAIFALILLATVSLSSAVAGLVVAWLTLVILKPAPRRN